MHQRRRGSVATSSFSYGDIDVRRIRGVAVTRARPLLSGVGDRGRVRLAYQTTELAWIQDDTSQRRA
jgi:hypothetical protein